MAVALGPGPSADDIKTAINSRNEDLRQCYIAGTFKNSQLAGTVTVTFVIATDGNVVEAKDAGSDLPDREVVDCVLQVFAGLEFSPGGVNETEVTYPVRFGASADG